jgi:hypothetical protein
MKRIVLFAVAVLFLFALVIGAAHAQVSVNASDVVTSKTYAANQKDTSAAYGFASARLLSLLLNPKDSVQVDIFVQYSLDKTTWSTVATDSLISTTDAGAKKEVSIRSGAAEKFSGIAGWLRSVKSFRASNQGTTSATYRETWYYKQ